MPPSFDSRDLIQEAQIALWRQAERFDAARHQHGSLDKYFRLASFRAVRGAVYMACRRRAYQDATTLELHDSQADPRPGPEETVGGRLAGARVRRAVAALPEQRRYIMMRHYFDGWGLAPLARHLHWPRARLLEELAAAQKELKLRLR